MGQSPSSYSTTAAAKAKGKSAHQAARRMRIRRIASVERRDDRFDGNRMINKEVPKLRDSWGSVPGTEVVLNCLGDSEIHDHGQRKLLNGRTEPETEQVTVDKIPSGNHHVPIWIVESGALSSRTDSSVDATGFSTRVSGLAWINHSDSQYDGNASLWTMEKKPHGERRERDAASEDMAVPGVAIPVGSVPLVEQNVRETRTEISLRLNEPPNIRVKNNFPHNRLEMTKTPLTGTSCPPKTIRPGERSNSCPVEHEDQEYPPCNSTKGPHDDVQGIIQGSQSFPGTIPRLIVTRDPSPTRTGDSHGPRTTELTVGVGGLSLDQKPGEESPCSDSGCGGSPLTSRFLRKLSSSSSAGLSSASSFEESEDDYTGSDIEPSSLSPSMYNTLGSPEEVAGTKSWRKLKTMVHWSPFMVSFKKRYPWVQLAGHAGRILEEELVRAREKPRLRRDMFEKMVAVDPGAPALRSAPSRRCLKPRYMQWRETLSSTATLGFRIEGIKKADGTCSTNFKKTKHREQVMKALKDFVDGNIQILKSYLLRLEELRSVLEKSDFFRTHEVVGSSLLFVHDASGQARVWMIDFGKTVTLTPPLTLDHRTAWREGNREDGYLWGLDNLIQILASMLP